MSKPPAPVQFKRETPFPKPEPETKTPAPVSLSAEQQAKYDQVVAHFQNSPGVHENEKSKTIVALTTAEKAWLSKECFLRYLRATKWNESHCIKRIESTLVWRRTFGVDPTKNLTSDMVSIENETGKQVVLGFDNDTRPCLYLKPGRQNTKATHRQVQHLVFMLERVIDFMVPGQDQLALLIDLAPHPIGKHNKIPSLGLAREVLSILQDHYPERLGKALLTNTPRLAQVFMKLIWPFIDTSTREKIHSNEPFPKFVPMSHLDAEYKGNVLFEYNHEKYWPALIAMSKARHQYFLTRHEELGGPIGHSESELREGFVDEKLFE